MAWRPSIYPDITNANASPPHHFRQAVMVANDAPQRRLHSGIVLRAAAQARAGRWQVLVCLRSADAPCGRSKWAAIGQPSYLARATAACTSCTTCMACSACVSCLLGDGQGRLSGQRQVAQLAQEVLQQRGSEGGKLEPQMGSSRQTQGRAPQLHCVADFQQNMSAYWQPSFQQCTNYPPAPRA